MTVAETITRTPARAVRSGKISTAIILWILGIPIPIILLIFLIKGCMT